MAKDLPAFPAAAVTPAGHAGTEEALRRQMLAQTRLNAKKVCMPAHANPFLHLKVSLPITALTYTRFHAEGGHPMHLFPRPLRPSHFCPSIHSLSRPWLSSETHACAPVAILVN
jgi:hypothetical protein